MLLYPLKSVIFLLIAIEHLLAFSFVRRKWDFLLPRDLMEKIFALEADSELDKMEVERLTDQLLKEVPRSVLDQLELPRFYSRLPFNVRWQIKDLLFDKSLSWRQKHEAIFALTQSVPLQKRRFAPIQRMPPAGAADASSPFGRPPTLAGTGHSRLFESVSALKYSVSFTFQIKELCDVLPQPLAVQIYSALASNTLNIDQKLATVESVMSELPFGILDRLFFVGVPIVDAEVRERFRRLWYDRPYWTSDTMEEEPKVPNEQKMIGALPIFLNVPPPAPPQSMGHASVRYQQQQMPPSFTSADLPPFPPPSLPQAVPIPAKVPTTVTIDEHYDVAAPAAYWRPRGLCAECNGMPDAMASVANIISSRSATGPVMPKANVVENSSANDQNNEDDHQQSETAELGRHQQDGNSAASFPLDKMPTLFMAQKPKMRSVGNTGEGPIEKGSVDQRANDQQDDGDNQLIEQHQPHKHANETEHLETAPMGGKAADKGRGAIHIRVPSFVESNGSEQAQPAQIASGEASNVILGLSSSDKHNSLGHKNEVEKSTDEKDKNSADQSEEEAKRQRIGSKIGKRELLTVDAQKQRTKFSANERRRAMIIRHKQQRTDRFRGRLQMRHINRLLGILQKQNKVVAY